MLSKHLLSTQNYVEQFFQASSLPSHNTIIQVVTSEQNMSSVVYTMCQQDQNQVWNSGNMYNASTDINSYIAFPPYSMFYGSLRALKSNRKDKEFYQEDWRLGEEGNGKPQKRCFQVVWTMLEMFIHPTAELYHSSPLFISFFSFKSLITESGY